MKYVCMNVCMYVCMYVGVYVCTYGSLNDICGGIARFTRVLFELPCYRNLNWKYTLLNFIFY